MSHRVLLLKSFLKTIGRGNISGVYENEYLEGFTTHVVYMVLKEKGRTEENTLVLNKGNATDEGLIERKLMRV